VPAVPAAALATGIDVLDMTLHRPSLADAFFALTGRALRDEDGRRDRLMPGASARRSPRTSACSHATAWAVFLTLAPIVVISVAGLSLANLYGATPGGSTAPGLPVVDEDGGWAGRAVRERLRDSPPCAR
jgi:hypothetical protein